MNRAKFPFQTMLEYKPFSTGLQLAALLLAFFLVFNGSCDGDGNDNPPDAGLYHTYAELDNDLHALATTHPQIAQVSSIGKSVEGRELWAIKISDNVNAQENETEVVFLGGHHAREWISIDVPYLIAQHLLDEYGSNPQITALVDNAEIWIVPMVNPDGHQYSVTAQRLWRKNRRNNGDGTFGVDLNRNYSYQWGGPGSSGDTYSEIYRGPSAFSEPETQAVRDFLQAHPPRALISYHSFSQLVLYPWGYTNNASPQHGLLDSLAVAIANRIRDVHGQTYIPEQASDLYLASGDTGDWLLGVLSVPGFTIELRPRSSVPGFELPENQIQPTFEENLPAALFLMEWAIAQGNVTL
ncbi:zinc carboxypeptidase [candidate division KSB1 bacterium]|nr:zinc carboxypeptidase [candidate division KSB1 bacterium]